jgi:hypothetical protein
MNVVTQQRDFVERVLTPTVATERGFVSLRLHEYAAPSGHGKCQRSVFCSDSVNAALYFVFRKFSCGEGAGHQFARSSSSTNSLLD